MSDTQEPVDQTDDEPVQQPVDDAAALSTTSDVGNGDPPKP